MKESSEKKYLVFPSTDGNKKVLAKFAKLWDKIKLLIETIKKGKKGQYKKSYAYQN